MNASPAAEQIGAVLARHPTCKRYWIACSGGLDSTVLAHLCGHLNRAGALRFSAIHVHHGLHPDADRWVAHTQSICGMLNLPLEVRRVDARPTHRESPEAAARRARYGALQAVMASDEAMLTAQHQDDQAETLLLQLLRGSGLDGLASMPEWAYFGPGFLCRPLLRYSRLALQNYAVQQGLQWIDDPSNAEKSLDRNFLRHEIIPRLQERWPALSKTLSRSARHCAEAASLLDGEGMELLQAARNPISNTLSLRAISGLSAPLQRLVLRAWLRSSGCRMPSAIITEQALHDLTQAGADRHPAVTLGECEVRRYGGELYLLRLTAPFDRRTVTTWHIDGPLHLPQRNGSLHAARLPGVGVDPKLWNSGQISVCYRQGGERLQLRDRSGTRELKKLLQEAAVEPWMRERLPLIYVGTQLAAVADLWVCEPFEGPPEEVNVRIRWERPALTLPFADKATGLASLRADLVSNWDQASSRHHN